MERAAFRAGRAGWGTPAHGGDVGGGGGWNAAEAALRGALDAALAGSGAAPFEVKALGGSVRPSLDTNGGGDGRRGGIGGGETLLQDSVLVSRAA